MTMIVNTLYGVKEYASKFCRVCKEDKSLDEFSTRNHTQDGSVTTLNTCKSCRGYQQKILNRLKKEYASLRTNRCDCCQRTEDEISEVFGKFNALERHGPMSVMQLDHNHKTEQFRGWICHHCNTLLSRANDEIDILEKAIAYLKRTTKEN